MHARFRARACVLARIRVRSAHRYTDTPLRLDICTYRQTDAEAAIQLGIFVLIRRQREPQLHQDCGSRM